MSSAGHFKCVSTGNFILQMVITFAFLYKNGTVHFEYLYVLKNYSTGESYSEKYFMWHHS